MRGSIIWCRRRWRLGASRLQPVLTRHTQVARVNLERMRANTIEAAQQCGMLNLPEIAKPLTFDVLMTVADPDRLLVFCDEDAEVKDPVAALAKAALRPQRAAAGGSAGRRRRWRC